MYPKVFLVLLVLLLNMQLLAQERNFCDTIKFDDGVNGQILKPEPIFGRYERELIYNYVDFLEIKDFNSADGSEISFLIHLDTLGFVERVHPITNFHNNQRLSYQLISFIEREVCKWNPQIAISDGHTIFSMKSTVVLDCRIFKSGDHFGLILFYGKNSKRYPILSAEFLAGSEKNGKSYEKR